MWCLFNQHGLPVCLQQGPNEFNKMHHFCAWNGWEHVGLQTKSCTVEDFLKNSHQTSVVLITMFHQLKKHSKIKLASPGSHLVARWTAWIRMGYDLCFSSAMGQPQMSGLVIISAVPKYLTLSIWCDVKFNMTFRPCWPVQTKKNTSTLFLCAEALVLTWWGPNGSWSCVGHVSQSLVAR